MITLSVFDIDNYISNLTIDQRQRMLSLVCVERQKKVAKIKLKERRDYALVAGYLLEQQLRRYIWEQYKEEVTELRFSYGKWGKPYLPEYPQVYFNMSHSGAYVAVAIGDSKLGVDVEVNSRNALAVAKRCFRASEYRRLLSYKDEPAQLDRYFKWYWSMKEAYIKYTGKGLKTPLHSFAVEPEKACITGQRQPVFYCRMLKDAHVSLCYEKSSNGDGVQYHFEVIHYC